MHNCRRFCVGERAGVTATLRIDVAATRRRDAGGPEGGGAEGAGGAARDRGRGAGCPRRAEAGRLTMWMARRRVPTPRPRSLAAPWWSGALAWRVWGAM